MIKTKQQKPKLATGKTFLDSLCEQLVTKRKKATKQVLDPLLILQRSMTPIREWIGELAKAPDSKALQAAELAIINAAKFVRPCPRKERTLAEAVEILKQRRNQLGIGSDLEEFKKKAWKHLPSTPPPKLFTIFELALIEEEQGFADHGSIRRRKFLNDMRAYQSRILSRKPWSKEFEKKFKSYSDFLPDPYDPDLRGQVAEMLLAYRVWLDKAEWPLKAVMKFLAEAGLEKPKALDSFLKNQRHIESKKLRDRERWRTNKADQRAKVAKVAIR